MAAVAVTCMLLSHSLSRDASGNVLKKPSHQVFKRNLGLKIVKDCMKMNSETASDQ